MDKHTPNAETDCRKKVKSLVQSTKGNAGITFKCIIFVSILKLRLKITSTVCLHRFIRMEKRYRNASSVYSTCYDYDKKKYTTYILLRPSFAVAFHCCIGMMPLLLVHRITDTEWSLHSLHCVRSHTLFLCV